MNLNNTTERSILTSIVNTTPGRVLLGAALILATTKVSKPVFSSFESNTQNNETQIGTIVDGNLNNITFGVETSSALSGSFQELNSSQTTQSFAIASGYCQSFGFS